MYDDAPPYAPIVSEPTFSQTVGNFNTRDYGIIGGMTIGSAPIGYVIGRQMRIPLMYLSAFMGGLGGFMLAMQNSNGRLMGWLPPQ